MKRFLLYTMIVLVTATTGYAQSFITKGTIEFEVKKNIDRMFGDIELSGAIELPTGLPKYDISYRDLIFSEDRWVYQGSKRRGEGLGMGMMIPSFTGSTMVDFTKQEAVIRKNIVGEEYLYKDSIQKVRWKIENEVRMIAGWKCRKAIGRIDDSIYVVAFYSPEIISSGGPELFSGLPGMILGLAIPRKYTTWFATKVDVVSFNEAAIVPPTIKKGKQLTRKELQEDLDKKYKGTSFFNHPMFRQMFSGLSWFLL